MSTRFLHRSVALLLFLLLAPVAWPAEVPKAVFSEYGFAFGSIKQGTAIEHDFILRNEGAGALRILGFGMTAPLMVGRIPAQIEPGTEIRVRVQLNTSKLSGPFEGQILISLNDPALPEVRLLFEGRVVPSIELFPHPVFFIAAQRGERRQAVLEIINHEREPLRILSVEHPLERFATKLETLEEGRRYRLTLIINPDGPGGKQTDNILVKTSSQRTPLLKIPANTYLRERVYTFPDLVDLGTLRLTDINAQPDLLQRTAQSLMVYQAGGTDFHMDVSSDLASLTVRAERGPQGDRYQTTVQLDPERVQAGIIRGTITIRTNDPEFPELRIPVTGQILNK